MIRIPTGVEGLDEMLGGGFPKGRVVLVCGEPGTGKTVFSLQFLTSAAERGTHGIYVALGEPKNLVKENTESFAWNINEKEKKGSLSLFNSGDFPWLHLSYERSRSEEDAIKRTFNKITDSAKVIGAKILVIDSLTSMTINEPSASAKRHMISKLFDNLRNEGYTTILTSQATSNNECYIEEILADGVIRLNKVQQNSTLIRTITIEKMRSVEHDEQPRRYVIDKKGFTVFSGETIKM